MSADVLLTVPGIAEHLGVSRSTVNRAVQAGDIKTAPSSGPRSLRIRRADLAAFIRTKAAGPDQKDGDMGTASDLPELFLFEDLAVRYRLNLASLKNAAYDLKFEHTRLFGSLYFTRPQLEAFLAARAVKAKTPDLAPSSLDRMREAAARRQMPRRKASTKVA
ncbi:helix-turn-helix transcriptional regulator [Winogradskya humida]|uniref:Helix-turn-helix domain-containing protein n=1 Tax=Winogradskya humida TaxID=113566 RepID=A0ABQ4A778_9ACTN|nr:helix-turn-helix domain-containing protein [Actinoplanes humidus]GIE26668.1 hypothetical protein Ahu01nite_097700 [Actinoplanes humidus]